MTSVFISQTTLIDKDVNFPILEFPRGRVSHTHIGQFDTKISSMKMYENIYQITIALPETLYIADDKNMKIHRHSYRKMWISCARQLK